MKDKNQIKIFSIGNHQKAQNYIKGILGFCCLATGVILGAGFSVNLLHHEIQGVRISNITNGASLKQVEASAENIKWVDIPISPFAEVGYSKDGSFSNIQAMKMWHLAGVHANDFEKIYNHLRKSGPAILGTKDVAMEKAFIEEAIASNLEIKTNWPDAWEKLSNPEWVKENKYKTINSPDVRRKVIYIDYFLNEEADFLYIHSSNSFNSITYNKEDAIKKVELAMQETGLRSLRFSSPIARDSEVMANIAQGLIEANNNLKERTRWDGKVLGLGGRVDYIFAGRMENPALSGTARLSNSYMPGKPQLLLKSGFKSIYHEWFHALDFVLAKDVFYFSHGHTMTKELNEYTNNNDYIRVILHKNNDIYKAMNELVHNISAVAPKWANHMHESSQVSFSINEGIHHVNEQYWNKIHERVAFAFTAQIRNSNNTDSEPLQEEANKQKPYFDAVFNTAQKLKLTERKPSTITNENKSTKYKKIKFN